MVALRDDNALSTWTHAQEVVALTIVNKNNPTLKREESMQLASALSSRALAASRAQDIRSRVTISMRFLQIKHLGGGGLTYLSFTECPKVRSHANNII
jgi:hypothetical protein